MLTFRPRSIPRSLIWHILTSLLSMEGLPKFSEIHFRISPVIYGHVQMTAASSFLFWTVVYVFIFITNECVWSGVCMCVCVCTIVPSPAQLITPHILKL